MEFQAEMKYVLDTIWLLISGALVMWMAAGFAMLGHGSHEERDCNSD
jgi:Amt family ammonium transporter